MRLFGRDCLLVWHLWYGVHCDAFLYISLKAGVKGALLCTDFLTYFFFGLSWGVLRCEAFVVFFSRFSIAKIVFCSFAT